MNKKQAAKVLVQPVMFLCYGVAAFGLALLVLMGYAMTWLYRRKGWPEETSAINCWAFACPKWLRCGTADSYLIVRKSKHTFVPHVFFTASIKGLVVEELKPLRPKRGLRGLIHAFWFNGVIKKGTSK